MPSPATSTPAGRPATATSTACPTSPRCAGPPGCRAPRWCCATCSPSRKRSVEVAPRRMLQRQLARAREAGFTVMGGSEIELYVFNETFASAQGQELPRPPADRRLQRGLPHPPGHQGGGAGRRHPPRASDGSGVPVEFSKGEAGLGQQEINLRYCEALTQCRPQYHLQARRQGDRLRAGQGDHLHGEVGREAHRVELPTST